MADRTDTQAVEERRRWVEGWNATMVDIWHERISKLRVIDTGELYHSPTALSIKTDADGRFLEFSLSHSFL